MDAYTYIKREFIFNNANLSSRQDMQEYYRTKKPYRFSVSQKGVACPKCQVGFQVSRELKNIKCPNCEHEFKRT